MSYWLKREFTYNPGIRYGGGGSAGEVDFPTHMKDIHKEWFDYSGSAPVMTTSLHDAMETALANNPLDNLSYTDPSSDIMELDTEIGEFETTVEALDAQADWQSIVDTAVSKVDSAGTLSDIDFAALISNAQTSAQNSLQKAVEKALEMIDSQVIVKAVTEFRRARQKERERMKTQYKANMANLGAERASSYGIGLALLEIDFERELGQYESEISRNLYQQGIQFYTRAITAEIDGRLKSRTLEKQTRDQMMMNSIQIILQAKQFNVEMKKILSKVMTEIKRISFVMDQEYTSKTLELNWKHATWEMGVYEKGTAVLGGMGGGTALPDSPSPAASAVGGAMTGVGTAAAASSALASAGAGASAGAVGGPVGLAAGAVIGGLAGYLSSR